MGLASFVNFVKRQKELYLLEKSLENEYEVQAENLESHNCQIFVRIGIIIGKNGIQMDPAKVQAIVKWSFPTMLQRYVV